MLTGKIFSFDGASGKGLIVLSNGEKLSFGVEHWADTENMPAISMAVEVDRLNGLSIRSSAKNVAAIQQTQTIEPAAQNISAQLEKTISEYINQKIGEKFKVERQDKYGFVLIKKEYRILMTILMSSLLSIPLCILFDWQFGAALAIVIAVANYIVSGKRTLIEGKAEGETIYLTGDDEREYIGEYPNNLEKISSAYIAGKRVNAGYKLIEQGEKGFNLIASRYSMEARLIWIHIALFVLLFLAVALTLGIIGIKGVVVVGLITIFSTIRITLLSAKKIIGKVKEGYVYLEGDNKREFLGEKPAVKTAKMPIGGSTIEELTQSYVDNGYILLIDTPDSKLLQPPNSLFDRLAIENKAGEIVVYDPNK
jgi:hypothetical protein